MRAMAPKVWKPFGMGSASLAALACVNVALMCVCEVLGDDSVVVIAQMTAIACGVSSVVHFIDERRRSKP